ncbi:MAG: HD domain-containing protein [Gemmatimonadales bacterium]|nr:HD domain-containing protein [Gemmatimonadales bacterium]NIN11477.1 HD domain-containing protein [Gemmatimonadales bacterium]NIN50086.1 HD domain-containing protein [Gemmatimonadales bacterium]NIP07550.1 HD domain-containing protein [Gemmatimonadales bacterium]NIR03192.1 HD domain-containing protein [Gemmatimonadales bacterium]
MCVLAIVLVVRASYEVPLGPDRALLWNTVGVLLAVGLVAEAAAIRIPGTSLTTSVVYVPILAGLLLVGPAWTMLVAAVTEVLSNSVIRHKPLVKIAHNAARTVLGVAAAGTLFAYAGGTASYSDFSPQSVPAFFGAAITYFLVVNGATATFVALSSTTQLSEAWNRIVSRDLVWNVLSSSISVLLAYLYVEMGVVGLVLLIVPMFLVRQTLQQNMQLEQANRDLLELMVKSIEARDPYTSGHSLRVAAYAKALARALGLPIREIEQIETAALLHDVGKIYEEYAPVLRKRGKLTQHEYLLMQSHPARSAELIRTISSLRGYVERCVRHHHENYDGSGYPDGLAGDEIAIGARIIMVADTVDAMLTDRPYRNARTYEDVLAEFSKYSGRQFDPQVVEAFRRSVVFQHLIEERRPKEEPEPAVAAEGQRRWLLAESPSSRERKVVR